MYTNRNAIVCGLSAGSGLPGHIRFSRSEYRYSMLWFSLVIGFLQKKCTENLEVMKFFILFPVFFGFRYLLSLPPPFPAESAVYYTFRRYVAYG